MKRKIIFTSLALIIIFAATGSLIALRNRTAQTETVAAAQNPPEAEVQLVSAPGLVEPVSEEIEVGAEIGGRLREVRVAEGDRVQRGQILAVLENNDYAAQLREAEAARLAAEAQLASTEARRAQAAAELRRTVNGARAEERREAQAAVEQADAVLRNARTELERSRRLVEYGDVPRQEYDRAERDVRVAEARSRELRERFAFVNAAAREEDVARAEANVRLTEGQIREARAQIGRAAAQAAGAQARLDKSFIRSPITGVVLRRRLQAGESVSPENPNSSIFTIADSTVLRVRVDIDETDVGRIHPGQRVYVTADAYRGTRFWGRILRIGQVMGRTNVRTEEPTERVDRKVLETLIELNSGQQLPLGLRVDAFIIVDGAPQS